MTSADVVSTFAWLAFAGMLGYIAYWTYQAWRADEALPRRTPGDALRAALAEGAPDIADLEIQLAQMSVADLDAAVRRERARLPH